MTPKYCPICGELVASYRVLCGKKRCQTKYLLASAWGRPQPNRMKSLDLALAGFSGRPVDSD